MNRFIVILVIALVTFGSHCYAQNSSNVAKSMTYFNLAQSNYNSKQYQEAIDYYTEAIYANPNDDKAYINRGIVYYDLKKYDQALSDFEKAKKINPNNPYAYYNTAIVYYASATNSCENDDAYFNYQKAKDNLTKAIQIDSNFYKAYINRGLINYELANYQDAINDFTKAIQINSLDYKAFYNRGIVYYALGNFNAASVDFTTAIEINPDDADAYFNRGLVYKKENNTKNATIDFYKAGLIYIKHDKRKDATECVDLMQLTDEFSTLIYDLKTKIVENEIYGS